jgi:hypothetical protein
VLWEHNHFVEARPALEAILQSPYARGGVTGVGVITAVAGLAELGGLVSRLRRGRRDTTPPA